MRQVKKRKKIMNAIKFMEDKNIKLFQTVKYNHQNPRMGVIDCIVTQIKTGGVMLRSVDSKDNMFLVRGDHLKRIIT
jgi:hypothetical protein